MTCFSFAFSFVTLLLLLSFSSLFIVYFLPSPLFPDWFTSISRFFSSSSPSFSSSWFFNSFGLVLFLYPWICTKGIDSKVKPKYWFVGWTCLLKVIDVRNSSENTHSNNSATYGHILVWLWYFSPKFGPMFNTLGIYLKKTQPQKYPSWKKCSLLLGRDEKTLNWILNSNEGTSFHFWNHLTFEVVLIFGVILFF